MLRLFKHYIPRAVLVIALCDFLALMLAAELAFQIRGYQIGIDIGRPDHHLVPLLTFAVALMLPLMAIGGYGLDALRSLRIATARILIAASLGALFIAFMHFILPTLTMWRSNSLYALLLAMILLLAVRCLYERIAGVQAFERRIVVLGAGARAERIEQLRSDSERGFSVGAYIAMTSAEVRVGTAVRRADIGNLADYVMRLRPVEVVVAIEERRNSLPLEDLLRLKMVGIEVIDIASFLERETGRVDLDTVNPSWFIFSDGFQSGQRVAKFLKRLFDIVVSLTMLALTLPIMLLTAIAIRCESRGPAIYRQTRAGQYGAPYTILKLRSMRQDAERDGALWAARGDPRVTAIGRLIRKVRVDELPQLWCVLRGEMSFIGPRPERPEFIQALHRDIPYYAERHMVKPGLTGWAQINYPYGASVDDARQKLEYDLYYVKNYSMFLDVLILIQTVRVILWPTGAR